MSDYKPITGELREKLAEYEPQETGDTFAARQVGRTGYDTMIAMCDAIDAIHAQLERENAALMDRDGWVELPKDVDGVPIFVGDELVDIGDTSHRGKARSIELREDSCDWIVFVGSIGRWSHVYRHVKPGTWERIIEDAIDAVDDCWANDEHDKLVDALVSRCKKLAGGAE